MKHLLLIGAVLLGAALNGVSGTVGVSVGNPGLGSAASAAQRRFIAKMAV